MDKDSRLRGNDSKIAYDDEESIRTFAKLTKLLGSVVLALAVKEQAISADEAIEAAFLEEVFQAHKWGENEEAAEKRAAKMVECREVIAAF
jgi:chaperone required for assembly of F1-ATPase